MDLEKLKKSFFERVIIKNDCWDWSGAKDQFGYGILSIYKYGTPRAHRASWMIYKGEIPKGLFVCHHCDNPICTNPEHLFLGTHVDNMRDRNNKKRHAYGSNNKSTIYDEKKVFEIKKMLCDGKLIFEIANIFGISQCNVFNIKSNKHWKEVDWPYSGIYEQEKIKFKKTRMTENDLKEIEKMLFIDKIKPIRISEKFGITRSAMVYIEKKLNKDRN